MNRTTRLLAAVFSLLPLAAQAFSGGAPICHAEDILDSPMGNPIANMGFSLSAAPTQYTPGQAMTLTLSNLDPGMTVRGVLLYVEDPDALDGDARPIKRGNFTAPYPTGIKAVFDGYPGCDFAGLTPVLTHDSDQSKDLPLTLTWQPPAIDTGDLRVRAIALMTFNAYQLLSLDLPVEFLFKDGFE